MCVRIWKESRSFAPQMNTDTAKSGLEDYFPPQKCYFSGSMSMLGNITLIAQLRSAHVLVDPSVRPSKIHEFSSPWSLHLPPCACHGGSHWNQTASALRSGFSKTWAEKPGTNHPQVPICCSASLNQNNLSGSPHVSLDSYEIELFSLPKHPKAIPFNWWLPQPLPAHAEKMPANFAWKLLMGPESGPL